MYKLFGNSGVEIIQVWVVRIEGKANYFSSEEEAKKYASVRNPVINIKVMGDKENLINWLNMIHH